MRNKRLETVIRFQKALRLAVEAARPGEAKAAEHAARRLMREYHIDPTDLTNKSLYDRGDFAGNSLLIKLREEYRTAHPPKPKCVRATPLEQVTKNVALLTG
jgi:hypothetical protein